MIIIMINGRPRGISLSEWQTTLSRGQLPGPGPSPPGSRVGGGHNHSGGLRLAAASLFGSIQVAAHECT